MGASCSSSASVFPSAAGAPGVSANFSSPSSQVGGLSFFAPSETSDVSGLNIPSELFSPSGSLSGTEFSIDSGRLDCDNEQHWAEYVERRRIFEEKLNILYNRMNRRPVAKLPENINYVRPFLSSTFKDFNEERNVCFAGSFPRLEKLCAERGVFFAPLDLRWGVTSEQSGSGQVIKICLEEIDRSRPYFVCSLGYRNGWMLSAADNPADPAVQLLKKTFEIGIQAFPWISSRMDRSVTELEILHGALNNPELAARSFFYFRDVSFLEKLPKEKRRLFVELGEPELRLQSLKLRIVLSGFKVRYFSTPAEMSDELEEDLKESIEKDFPTQKLSALDRELKDHQAFVDMRTRVYVGGEKYIEKLDEYINGSSNRPFVISGPSGGGKSSVISNWMKSVKDRIKNNRFPGKLRPSEDSNEGKSSGPAYSSSFYQSPAGPGTNVLHWNLGLVQDRFIGATSDSTQPATLIRWILQEIKSRFEYIEQNIPQDNKKLIEEFPDWLELASASAPLLLVLDGLDQLVEVDDAHSLNWLPFDFPKGVRVVVSTVTDSETHRALQDRGCEGLEIQPLTDAYCLQLIRDFLGSYGKKLDDEQETRIMNCERTRNPLYLITFLQEVRVFGSYENLSKRIDHYMDARSVSEMFLKVIQRLEEDFDSAVPGLVQNTLCLMMLSRRGLNEVELKGALELALHVSALQQSFPNMEFSALMLRLDQQLVDQRGLRTFSHNYLRQAVQAKYLTDKKDEIHYHRILADYFESVPVSDRKVEEMPWHLWTILQFQPPVTGAAGNSSLFSPKTASPPVQYLDTTQLATFQLRLQNLLTDLDMFDLLKGEFKYDLHKYWLLLEQSRHSADLAARSYSAALSAYNKKHKPKPLPFAEKAEDVGTFLISTDRYQGADVYLDQALEFREKEQGAEHPDIEILLSKKANLYYRQGRFDEALPLYQKALKIVEMHEGNNSVRSSVLRTSIAGLLKEQGKFEASEPLYQKSLQDKIALLGPRHPVVAISMSNLADLHLRMFKPERALPLYEEALSIMETERGRNHPQVATILSSLASCYMQLKKFDESIKLYERAKKIKEDLYGANHISVAVVLNNLAATYHSQGDHSKALKLYEKSLKIRQQTHGKESALIAPTLNNIGLIYLAEGKYRTSLSYFTQALTIMESAYGKYHLELVNTLNSMSKIHMEEKKYETALLIYTRELEILEKSYGVQDERIHQALNNVGMVYQSLNQFDRALPFHLREFAIIQGKYGEIHLKCAEILMIIGVVYASMENKEDDALNAFKRCYCIRRQLLSEENESTQEAKGWVMDLSENEEEIEWEKMKIEEIPQIKLEGIKIETPTRRLSLPPIAGNKLPGITGNFNGGNSGVRINTSNSAPAPSSTSSGNSSLLAAPMGGGNAGLASIKIKKKK